jgi:hypothetical protein
MDNTSPSQEEIRNKREFAYRAFSPDSEPPSPLQDEKKQKNRTDPAGEPTEQNQKSAPRENGRQNA